MKNSLHTNPLMFKIVILLTCFMLVMVYNKSKAQGINRMPAAIEKNK
ncbi:MAG: hypothetical protein ABJA78_09630 [Ferruginibacter sp.]